MEASSASPDSSLPLDHLPAVLTKPQMLHLSAEGEGTSQHVLSTKSICVFLGWRQQFQVSSFVTSTHASPPVGPACSLASVVLLYHNWRWAKEQVCLNQGSFCYLQPKVTEIIEQLWFPLPPGGLRENIQFYLYYGLSKLVVQKAVVI